LGIKIAFLILQFSQIYCKKAKMQKGKKEKMQKSKKQKNKKAKNKKTKKQNNKKIKNKKIKNKKTKYKNKNNGFCKQRTTQCKSEYHNICFAHQKITRIDERARVCVFY